MGIILNDDIFENGCDYVSIHGTGIQITREQNDTARLEAARDKVDKAREAYLTAQRELEELISTIEAR